MMRRGGGSLGIGATPLAQAMRDGKIWAGVGLVVKRQGESQHYEIGDGDVLVSVDLMPEGQPLWCRLGAAGGGLGNGVLRVPQVGAEVLVLVPRGELEEQPSIVAVLSSGAVDGDLDGDTLLIVNDKKVKIKTTDGDIALAADDNVTATSAHGKVILGATSGGKEIARKGDKAGGGHLSINYAGSGSLQVQYTPGDGSAPVTFTNIGAFDLAEKILEGSSKANAAD